MFDKFTPRARQVIILARKEADRFNHDYIGTEHLLLGLVRLGQGVAMEVLREMGVDFETLRIEVEKAVGSGPDTKVGGEVPLTPKAKRVLELAMREAKKLQHSYIGTEHLLLGLIEEGEGVAAMILKNLGSCCRSNGHPYLMPIRICAVRVNVDIPLHSSFNIRSCKYQFSCTRCIRFY